MRKHVSPSWHSTLPQAGAQAQALWGQSGTGNNQALSAPSSQCHAPGSSVSQPPFQKGGWQAAASIVPLYPCLTVLRLSFDCPPTSAPISGLLALPDALLPVGPPRRSPSACFPGPGGVSPCRSLSGCFSAFISVSTCVYLSASFPIFFSLSVLPLDSPSLQISLY